MKTKLLLAIILVSAIFALMFFTEKGRDYLLFLQENVPSAISNFLASLNILKTQISPGEYFLFSLIINKNAISDYNFNAINSTIFVRESKGRILINQIPLTIPKDYSLRIINSQGEIVFGDLIRANLNAEMIYINEITYGPNNLKINFEISSNKFIVSGVEKGELTFQGITGELTQLAEDGSLKKLVNLANEELMIKNFFGSIRVDEKNAYLQGFATLIKGKDFEWPG